jgi:hypothetical protein
VDFVMGTLLIVAISNVRSIQKQLDAASKRYRRLAHQAFGAWAFLLGLVITLAFVHAFHSGINNTIHINNIMNLIVELINTLQVYNPQT